MNDKIEFKVNVKDEATSELRNIDNEFKKVDKSVNNLNSNINSIGNSFVKASSILKGVLGAEILKNFAQLGAEASESNKEFNRMISSVRFLSAEVDALKNVEIFENFKGKDLFDPKDMQVAFKNARNSTLGFSADILNIFGDIATGVGINLEEVSEIFTGNIEENVEGFHLLPRRWVVERTFAWLSRFRRLSKDYERKPTSSAGHVYVASIRLMLRRIMKERTLLEETALVTS